MGKFFFYAWILVTAVFVIATYYQPYYGLAALACGGGGYWYFFRYGKAA